MHMSPYAARLHDEFAAAVDGASPEIEAAAARLSRILDPAVRLMLFDVLADAAAEITAALPSGSVTVRLTGRDLEFVIEGVDSQSITALTSVPDAAYAVPTPPPSPSAPWATGESAGSSDGDLARMTVRVPEGVKERAERLADHAGQSLNGWIVNTLRAATTPERVSADGSRSSVADPPVAPRRGSGRMTGWV